MNNKLSVAGYRSLVARAMSSVQAFRKNTRLDNYFFYWPMFLASLLANIFDVTNGRVEGGLMSTLMLICSILVAIVWSIRWAVARGKKVMLIIATIGSYLLAWAIPIEVAKGDWKKLVQKGIWVGTTTLNATAYVIIAGVVQVWFLVFSEELRIWAALSLAGTLLEITMAAVIVAGMQSKSRKEH